MNSMAKNLDIITYAVSLIVKAVVMASGFSGRARKRSLKRLARMDAGTKEKELLFLRDKVHQLQMQLSILQKRIKKQQKKPHYTIRERLFILWHMETFQIPRRKVFEQLGVSRSTLYRWLNAIQNEGERKAPANKTPMEIAALIWEITKPNISWGRVRIANQLALLNVFISASAVRNVLQRPAPDTSPTAATTQQGVEESGESKSIPPWYPNHVWSIDTTELYCWGLWPVQVCVVIDHFSPKVVCVTPLEGRNAGWIINPLETAIEKHGVPRHMISDQGSVFIGGVFADLMERRTILPRLGAIGKHGSIAVTERVIKTLKYERFQRVPIIRSFDHLTELCDEFSNWYNLWRPHMKLEGHHPDDVYYDRKPKMPRPASKTVPNNIETHLFQQTRVTGYRLKSVA